MARSSWSERRPGSLVAMSGFSRGGLPRQIRGDVSSRRAGVFARVVELVDEAVLFRDRSNGDTFTRLPLDRLEPHDRIDFPHGAVFQRHVAPFPADGANEVPPAERGICRYRRAQRTGLSD